MAQDKQPQLDIERARDLLSPYLDDEVTAEERRLVEQVVAASDETRRELETLRQTVSLVAGLPQMPAPRPFTLSEADVQPSPPAISKYFNLPTWATGWAMLAATLLCVLAMGGVFLRSLSGLPAAAPAAEIAMQKEAAVPVEEAAAPAEEEDVVSFAEAPVEEAAPPVETRSEAGPEEGEPAPLREEQAAAEAVEVEVEKEVEPEIAPAEPSETLRLADEILETAESQPVTNGESIADSGVEDDAGESFAATASPLPTVTTPTPLAQAAPATPSPAPTAEASVGKAGVAEESPPEAAVAESETAPDSDEADLLAPGEETITPRPVDIAPRPVNIQNPRVRVTPGLIQIEGTIEAMPGSILLASLRRNNEFFDDWADPASLQTVVQPNGRFVFVIQAQAGRADRDLFKLEPANYQITIISTGVDEPVTTSVFFATVGAPTPTEAPPATSTSTPHPTATVVARLTVLPSATFTPTGLQTAPSPEAGDSQSRPIVVTSIVLLGLLIIIGLVVFWLITRKQKH